MFSDEKEKLAVFFPNVDKLNKMYLSQICKKMIDINVMKGIIIQKGSTSMAVKVLSPVISRILKNTNLLNSNSFCKKSS